MTPGSVPIENEIFQAICVGVADEKNPQIVELFKDRLRLLLREETPSAHVRAAARNSLPLDTPIPKVFMTFLAHNRNGRLIPAYAPRCALLRTGGFVGLMAKNTFTEFSSDLQNHILGKQSNSKNTSARERWQLRFA